ncbi:MAG: hypothetical protein CK533_12060 [Acidobacterium sp.]|nr:MAG: hypothetical protein CK533_12060 [Acidobacterium sp.]
MLATRVVLNNSAMRSKRRLPNENAFTGRKSRLKNDDCRKALRLLTTPLMIARSLSSLASRCWSLPIVAV